MTSYYLTYETTHHVMDAEKKLLDKGVRPRIVPTPKEVESACVFSLMIRIHDKDLTKVKSLTSPSSILEFRFCEGGNVEYIKKDVTQ